MAAGVKTGGRQKGTPNKNTADVREMVLRALNKAGGVDYLARQARENPAPFMTLVGKVLPTQAQITGADGKDLIPPESVDPQKLALGILAIMQAAKPKDEG
jgi:hypothetical protein